MSAAVSVDPGIANAQAAIVDAVRAHVRQAINGSEGFPDDHRLAKAQVHLVAALAELVKYEKNIGGTP